MKGIKNNKKGFTLIELLAVIVVLAIVMVLATTTVLPLMNDAKKNSFAIEATDAINAASTLVTVMPLNTMSNLSNYRDETNNAPKNVGDANKNNVNYNFATSGNKRGFCFSIKMLAEVGIYKKDLSYFNGSTPEYEGRVIVVEDLNTNQYTYKLNMHNANFEITKGTTSSYGGKNVNPKGKDTTAVYNCQSFSASDLA